MPEETPAKLADFLRGYVEKGHTLKSIEERARLKGHQLTQGYLSKLINGYAENPSISIVKAIAAGVGYDIQDLLPYVFDYQPRGSESVQPDEQQLLARFRRMSRTGQQALLKVADSLAGMEE
ncbi:MAG TPA: hypothetical protein VNQ79_06800 [Blastocatellia bacterium]|nr:hypothetical protein [Blastocatellia bacterium]